MIALIQEWQTMLGSLFAIGAALIGGTYINRQIQQVDRLNIERQRRRLLAARAVLPLALSSLSQYTRDCAVEMRRALDLLQDDRLPRGNELEFPAPPAAAITTLTDVIEASGDDGVAVPIANLLSEIQVLSSRLRSIERNHPPRSIPGLELKELILDIADTDAQIMNVFDFSRRESEKIPLHLERNDVRRSLRILGFYDEGPGSLEALSHYRWDRAALARLRAGKANSGELAVLVSKCPDYLMKKINIVQNEETYHYRDYRYGSLSDAAAYALIEECETV